MRENRKMYIKMESGELIVWTMNYNEYCRIMNRWENKNYEYITHQGLMLKKNAIINRKVEMKC